MSTFAQRSISSVLQSAKDTLRVSKDLYVVMIPVIILVKLLQEFELIQYVAMPLRPIMELVGLPPEMGLAWAAALLNNMYSGIIVFLQLAQQSPDTITTAQVTILAGMMHIAHAIPVECGIAHRCGARFVTQATIRVGCAMLYGITYHALAEHFQFQQGTAAIPLPFEHDPSSLSWLQWSLSQGQKLLWISLVIFVLMIAMNILKTAGILNLISKTLEPVMRLIGVGRKASTITMIGMTLGLSYGSGIIIQEAQKGELSKEDIFFSLSFMGICHSLIEDTLLVIFIGADFMGVLVFRTLLCLALIAILVRSIHSMPSRIKTRYLWTPEKAAT